MYLTLPGKCFGCVCVCNLGLRFRPECVTPFHRTFLNALYILTFDLVLIQLLGRLPPHSRRWTTSQLSHLQVINHRDGFSSYRLSLNGVILGLSVFPPTADNSGQVAGKIRDVEISGVNLQKKKIVLIAVVHPQLERCHLQGNTPRTQSRLHSRSDNISLERL